MSDLSEESLNFNDVVCENCGCQKEFLEECECMKTDYRIQLENGRYKNAGSNYPSWFNLDDARKLVDRDKNERIVEHDGENILWEVF